MQFVHVRRRERGVVEVERAAEQGEGLPARADDGEREGERGADIGGGRAVALHRGDVPARRRGALPRRGRQRLQRRHRRPQLRDAAREVAGETAIATEAAARHAEQHRVVRLLRPSDRLLGVADAPAACPRCRSMQAICTQRLAAVAASSGLSSSATASRIRSTAVV